jgi:DNA-binding CsgD family transcriptional regulator
LATCPHQATAWSAHWSAPLGAQNGALDARCAPHQGIDQGPHWCRLLTGGPRFRFATHPRRSTCEPQRKLYELTQREQQVTQLLVRGLAIDEIAQTLWLSRHTVRDHVKAIFSKTGVTSRPELTAKLFAEQFLPELECKPPPTI